MNYSAVLIDDELHCTESLEMLLNRAGQQVRVVAKFNDPVEALAYLNSHKIDLIFLDIEMPVMNGFSFLENLKEYPGDVIFTTAYDQYAIRAFHYSAVSYLLKPIDPDELAATVARWLAKQSKGVDPQQLRLLHHYFLNPGQTKSRLAVPTSDGVEFLDIQQIIRCESESNYTWLYLTGEVKLLVCRTLKEVEAVLNESGFLRIHHSHLINPGFVKKILRHDGGSIVMEDGTQLSISRTRKDRLFDLFEHVRRL